MKLSFSDSLIHTKDIINNFSSERSMDLRLKSLVDENRLQKIKNGLYATVNPITGDIFASRYEIASALFPNACVAYHSALEFYGLSNQMFSEVQVYTEKRNIPFYCNDLVYKFLQTNIKGGIVSLEHNSKITITNLERTIIDCIDRLGLAGGLEEVILALNGITYLDEKLLLEYLGEYNEKLLYKKVGFLLSKFKSQIISKDFLLACHEKISYKIDSICENKLLPHKSDKYWKIIYPEKSINMEN